MKKPPEAPEPIEYRKVFESVSIGYNRLLARMRELEADGRELFRGEKVSSVKRTLDHLLFSITSLGQIIEDSG